MSVKKWNKLKKTKKDVEFDGESQNRFGKDAKQGIEKKSELFWMEEGGMLLIIIKDNWWVSERTGKESWKKCSGQVTVCPGPKQIQDWP